MWNPTLGRYLVTKLCLGSPVSWSWTNFTTHTIEGEREREICVLYMHALHSYIYINYIYIYTYMPKRHVCNDANDANRVWHFFQIAKTKRPVFGARSAWQVLTSWCRWVMRWPRMSPSPPIPMWVASARPLSALSLRYEIHHVAKHSLSAKAGFWS